MQAVLDLASGSGEAEHIVLWSAFMYVFIFLRHAGIYLRMIYATAVIGFIFRHCGCTCMHHHARVGPLHRHCAAQDLPTASLSVFSFAYFNPYLLSTTIHAWNKLFVIAVG